MRTLELLEDEVALILHPLDVVMTLLALELVYGV